MVKYVRKKTDEGVLRDDMPLAEAMALLEKKKCELVGWDYEQDDDDKEA